MATKQKVVIRVTMNDRKKCFGCAFSFWGAHDDGRSKALKLVVGVSGVESAALKGTEKDEIEVVGEIIDSVKLIRLLRKNFGSVTLVSVGPDGDKKPKTTTTPAIWVPSHSYAPPYHMYQLPTTNEPFCSIL